MTSSLPTDPGKGRPSSTDADHRCPIPAGDIRLFQTTEPFSCRVVSAPGNIAVLRNEATAVAVRRGFTNGALHEVRLAVSEAAANALMHGSAAPTASIGMAIEFEHGDMQVTISDDGNACAAPQTPGRHGGRGMPIINAFTKGDVALTIGAHSTTIEMDFACPSRADHASLVRRRRPVRT